jgi:hypothetical protein
VNLLKSERLNGATKRPEMSNSVMSGQFSFCFDVCQRGNERTFQRGNLKKLNKCLRIHNSTLAEIQLFHCFGAVERSASVQLFEAALLLECYCLAN